VKRHPDEILVLVFTRLEDRHLEQIQAVDPSVRAVRIGDPQQARELAPHAAVMVGWSIPAEVLAQARRLRWVHSSGAGVERLLVPPIVDSDVVVTDSSGIHSAMVEHVYAVILAFARRLHVAIRLQLAHRWDHAAVAGDELRGKTLAVIGLGAIGRDIARAAAAFDLRVIGVKRRPEPVAGVSRVVPPAGLHQVLREADYVLVALPLTPATRGLIGEPEFAAMKPSAVFINIGRGAIVDETALIAALRDGRIAGAGLDVFVEEPLPPDSPFYEMANVIVTPHVAGSTPRYFDRVTALLSENLRRFLNHEPLLNVVDKELGY
jgi:phosphoglycerate dehydrogenase-like enzyme